ncbi:hypothetical protein [Streptomyces sp. NBC_01530]|uniref:hypothetical protein n=1 Tax=Streptomyces sp. NBC_01530 TaxID=2903895 RepID=UPI0038633C22
MTRRRGPGRRGAPPAPQGHGEPADAAEAYLYRMGGGYSTGSVVTVSGGTLV